MTRTSPVLDDAPALVRLSIPQAASIRYRWRAARQYCSAWYIREHADCLVRERADLARIVRTVRRTAAPGCVARYRAAYLAAVRQGGGR